jgi:uncharacterized protein with von Willebrand factor type A (vWA) domain
LGSPEVARRSEAWLLAPLVAELRASGLSVSTSEVLDAIGALRAVGLGRRDLVSSALSSTLAKSAEAHALFARVFPLFFPEPGQAPGEASAGSSAGVDERDEPEGAALAGALMAAAGSGDRRRLGALAASAVRLHGGLEPGRPVAGTFALWRTAAQLGLERVLDGREAFLETGEDSVAGDDPLLRWRVRERRRRAAAVLRGALEAEVRRRLLEDRGPEALAATLRRPLSEDVDLLGASAEQLAQLRRAVAPLARHLSARLGRRRTASRGLMDGPSTLRRTLATGGVPVELLWERPRPAKPKLWVLADVSGSVASFSRFTLGLVQALDRSFASVRTFVFVDTADDVSVHLRRGGSAEEAWARVARLARPVRGDGHSDYGAVLAGLAAEHLAELDQRTTVLVLGDARTNYHPPRVEALAALATRARSVLWLNPERRAYWGTGDSAMDDYAPLCDAVFECRTLRGLREVVAALP